MLPITWLNSQQNSETAGMIKKALEIANRANHPVQDTSSQNHDVQLIQQNVQVNFKMSPQKASMLSE
jgi:hypothetical protein